MKNILSVYSENSKLVDFVRKPENAGLSWNMDYLETLYVIITKNNPAYTVICLSFNDGEGSTAAEIKILEIGDRPLFKEKMNARLETLFFGFCQKETDVLIFFGELGEEEYHNGIPRHGICNGRYIIFP